MPLKVKSQDGWAVIKKIGVAQPLYDWAFAQGCTVNIAANGFHIAMPDGSNEQHVAMSLTELTKVQTNALTHTAKLNLQSQLGNALMNLQTAFEKGIKVHKSGGSAMSKLPPIQKAADDNVLNQLASAFGDNAVSVEGLADFLEEQGLSLTKADAKKSGGNVGTIVNVKAVSANDWPLADLDTLHSAPLVKLRDAEFLYQPVQGTSSGSRYFMVAANSDIKVAVRWQNETLSVRVEGPQWDKYKGKVKEAGIDNLNEEYASMHLKCGTLQMATKALGAVLASMQVPFETPIPNLYVLTGAA